MRGKYRTGKVAVSRNNCAPDDEQPRSAMRPTEIVLLRTNRVQCCATTGGKPDDATTTGSAKMLFHLC